MAQSTSMDSTSLVTAPEVQIMFNTESSPFSLAPLPPALRHGLAAVATFGFISFFSSLALLVFLGYRIASWTLKDQTQCPNNPAERPESPQTDDDGFLVPLAVYLPPDKPQIPSAPEKESVWQRVCRNPPNQFLVLIMNLLLADLQQAVSSLINVAWLSRDAVVVGSSACWAQGWFVSVGDLASSVFISLIAIHSYLGVVQDFRLPSRLFYSIIAGCWLFIFGTAILGVLVTRNGAGSNGFYVRAGAWCWVNSLYQNVRLYLHYLWIFLSLALTTVVYIMIFIHTQKLGRRNRQREARGLPGGIVRSTSRAEHYPNPDPNQVAKAPDSPRSLASSIFKELPPIPAHARQQTFLLYPLVYVLCTVPLAAGRLASMTGRNVSLGYFCFAGAMIACNGWLDVLLYSSTRRAIVFSGGPPTQDTGIHTFSFMRTPPSRRFGNMVFVSGGQQPKRTSGWAKWGVKALGAKVGSLSGLGSDKAAGPNGSLQGFGMSKGGVMGMAIQCETTTTVSVEIGEAQAGSQQATVGELGRSGSMRSTVSTRSARSQRPAQRVPNLRPLGRSLTGA